MINMAMFNDNALVPYPDGVDKDDNLYHLEWLEEDAMEVDDEEFLYYLHINLYNFHILRGETEICKNYESIKNSLPNYPVDNEEKICNICWNYEINLYINILIDSHNKMVALISLIKYIDEYDEKINILVYDESKHQYINISHKFLCGYY